MFHREWKKKIVFGMGKKVHLEDAVGEPLVARAVLGVKVLHVGGKGRNDGTALVGVGEGKVGVLEEAVDL
jgi:hypothetical protein